MSEFLSETTETLRQKESNILKRLGTKAVN